MCRFLGYIGQPVFLDSLLVEPAASLIAQSLAAREAKTIVNGDGCGIGWYGERDEPGLYHGVLPAWSDSNLSSLCRQLRSRLFLAHVRSATTGEVSAANCHPFAAGRHLFMHNGQIGDYERVRRRVDALIPDALYSKRRGNGDSEAIFLAALGRGLATDPQGAVVATLQSVRRIMRNAGITKPLRFAAIHTDGAVLRCYRWSSDERAPSLYWRRTEAGVVVASEPIDDAVWEMVPPGSVMTIDAAGDCRREALEIGTGETLAAA
jgi:glutamine amidotransferase